MKCDWIKMDLWLLKNFLPINISRNLRYMKQKNIKPNNFYKKSTMEKCQNL